MNVTAPSVSVRDYASGYLNRFHAQNDAINILPLAKGSSEQLFAIAAEQNGSRPNDAILDRGDIEGFLGSRIDGDRNGVLDGGELHRLEKAFNPATPAREIGLADAYAARVFTQALPGPGVIGPIVSWLHWPGSPYNRFLTHADQTNPVVDGLVGFRDIRNTVARFGVDGTSLDAGGYDRFNQQFPGVV